MDDNGTDGQWRFVPTQADYLSGKYAPGEYIVEITGTTRVSQESKKAYFNIILTDPCDPPTITPPADLVDQVYTLTDQSHADYITAAWTVSPDYCEVDFTQSCTTLVGGNTAVSQKAATTISSDGQVTYAFEWLTDLSPLGQTQTCTVTATSKSMYGTNNAATSSVDFDVTFENPCVDTDFVNIEAPGTLSDLEYPITSGAKQYTHEAFTVSTVPFSHDICGDLTCTTKYNSVVVGASDTPFAYSDPANDEITINSNDANLIGQEVPYSIECKFLSHPTAPSAQNSALVKYTSPCVELASLTATSQTGPVTDEYTGNVISNNIQPFTVSPDICKVKYTCNEVTRQDSNQSALSCSDLNFPDPETTDCATESCPVTITIPPEEYGPDGPKPGCFDVNFCGVVEGSSPPVEECADMVVCLTDPCDPPTTMVMAPLVDQEYIIYNDGNPSYTRPPVIIVPDYCPFTVETKISYFKDFNGANQNAISQATPGTNEPDFYQGTDERQFTFKWMQDLSPLDQTQQVQVQVKSYSIHQQNDNNAVIINDNFDLDFKSPCGNALYNTITPKT